MGSRHEIPSGFTTFDALQGRKAVNGLYCLSQQEIDIGVRGSRDLVLDPKLQRLSATTKQVATELSITLQAAKKHSLPQTAPLITSTFLQSIAMEGMQDATTQFMSRQIGIPHYVCQFDTNAGISRIAVGIINSEAVKTGTLDSDIIHSLSSTKAVNFLPLQEQMDFFLRLRGERVENYKLLENDPTGKTLIKRILKRIEESYQQELSPFEKDFFIEGAKFAEQAYNIVYPLAQNLVDQST